MSTETTRRMIAAYIQMASPTLFLSGMFKSPPANFHATEEVEIDIIRSEEDVAIAIQDLSTGYNFNSTDIYTNKSFKPPIHKEAVAINAFDLLKRTPGENPFEQPDFKANIITRIFQGMVKVERKIRRAVELQASQVLQLGVVTLIDSDGNEVYAIDYKPKATHLPKSSAAWGGGSEVPLTDLNSLCEVIRNDGLADPDALIFGATAFENFIKHSTVQTRFDNRRIDMGRIVPMLSIGQGASYRGVVEIGNYKLDVFTYNGRYKHPSSGTITQFITPTKVIVMASGGRLDATFGAIPNIGQLLNSGANQVLAELPGRIANASGGMDMFANAWVSNDGEQLFGGFGARPLMIPTAIDTYGCLDTTGP